MNELYSKFGYSYNINSVLEAIWVGCHKGGILWYWDTEGNDTFWGQNYN